MGVRSSLAGEELELLRTLHFKVVVANCSSVVLERGIGEMLGCLFWVCRSALLVGSGVSLSGSQLPVVVSRLGLLGDSVPISFILSDFLCDLV